MAKGAVKRPPEEHKAYFAEKLRQRGDITGGERAHREYQFRLLRLFKAGKQEMARAGQKRTIYLPR